MSNVPANVSDLDVGQLTALMSGGASQQAQSEQSDLLPLLRTNYQEEDDDGNELKKGTFVLDGKDIEKVYAKEVQFRALGDFMQYLHYDSDEQKTVNRTIIHRVGDEAIDETGTLRCGRPAGKDFHALDEKEKSKYQGITCFRYIYGLVSYKGTNAEGEEREVVETPCLFRTKGASFMNFTKEVIEPSSAQNLPFQNVTSTLSNERKRNGGVIYFTSHFSPDFKKTAELSPDNVETMKHILTLIKNVNDSVRAKYNESIKARTASSNEADVVDAIIDSSAVLVNE